MSIRADSVERNAAITSPAKSEEPGVSHTFILMFFHVIWARDAYIEIFRSISSGELSLTVFPDSVVSGLEMLPPAYSKCSKKAVFPVWPCPARVILRI